MFGTVFLYWFLHTARLPKAANIFRAMGESSPLFTHSLPWSSMGVSLGAAAILLLIAKRVVETLEY
jgi:type II secretory pathway component PulF